MTNRRRRVAVPRDAVPAREILQVVGNDDAGFVMNGGSKPAVRIEIGEQGQCTVRSMKT